ncbi:MAG: hypothetical protein MZV49_26195 [Rhodopseudomonas palustris]|nr:hypothetical protein [Rhodopseudomonas palustris]
MGRAETVAAAAPCRACLSEFAGLPRLVRRRQSNARPDQDAGRHPAFSVHQQAHLARSSSRGAAVRRSRRGAGARHRLYLGVVRLNRRADRLAVYRGRFRRLDRL